MKIFEITFWSGETLIQFGESRTQLRRKFQGFGISKIEMIVIH